LSNNAVSLNVQLLARRFGEELGPLASALSRLKDTGDAEDLATAFESYQVEQLDALERQHIEWSLDWLIADLSRRQPGHIPRGPRLIRENLLGTAPNRPLETAIKNVTKLAADRGGSPASRLKFILDRYNMADVLMIAAVVAYHNGAWAQARDFGERALNRLRNIWPDNTNQAATRSLAELEYLAALCRRFELCETVPQHLQTDHERNALRSKFNS